MSNELTIAENTLLSEREKIQTLIPKEQFEKFRLFIASASLDNNNLNLATYPSITKAFIDCAKSGLMPDGKEAVIVTRYVKDIQAHVASFQPMVKGAVKIINESPRIKSFHVKTVYKSDEFEMWADENGDHLKYKPSFDEERTDANIKLFYAVAVLDNDSTIIEVMTRSQVDKHKALAKQTYVWDKWYSEMGIKTIIHRILKRLPVSNEALIEGLESSLDINLSNDVTDTDVDQRPDHKLFKSKEQRLEYVFGIANAVKEEESTVAAELWNELDREQQMNIWGEFGTAQKKFIRESLDEVRKLENTESED